MDRSANLALVPPEEKCKVCTICKQEKPITEFYLRSSRRGRASQCGSCSYRTVKTKLTKSPENRLQGALENAKHSSKKKGKEFSIFLEDLIGLWVKQNGLCFYSNVSMTFDGSNKYTTVSLDRIDSSKGYVANNVVLCCTFVNKMKNDIPVDELADWCGKIHRHLTSIEGCRG